MGTQIDTFDFCDRCKKEVKIAYVSLMEDGVSLHPDICGNTAELCESCTKAFQEWWTS